MAFQHVQFLYRVEPYPPHCFILFSYIYKLYTHQNLSHLLQPIVFVSDRARANKEIEHGGIQGEKRKKKPKVREHVDLMWRRRRRRRRGLCNRVLTCGPLYRFNEANAIQLCCNSHSPPPTACGSLRPFVLSQSCRLTTLKLNRNRVPMCPGVQPSAWLNDKLVLKGQLTQFAPVVHVDDFILCNDKIY